MLKPRSGTCVVPRSLGGKRTIPLCDACHAKVHGIHNPIDIRKLTKEALQTKKDKGERVGQIPFGYELADDCKSIRPKASEQMVLMQIRAMRANGMALRAITRALNNAGVPARGKRWHLTSVARLIKRL